MLGQVNGRRMVTGGDRAVQHVHVAFGQTQHFSDVLQLIAQRSDLLEIERHNASNRFRVRRPGGLQRQLGLGVGATAPSPGSQVSHGRTRDVSIVFVVGRMIASTGNKYDDG